MRSCDQLLNIAFNYNLTQIVTGFTRVGAETSTLLDLVFVSYRLCPFVTDIEDGISDHKMVVTSLSMCARKLLRPSKMPVLKFALADDVSILDYLEASLDAFLVLADSGASVDDLWNFFSDMVNHCVLCFVPKKFKTTNRKNPWITREIIHAKRRLKRMRASSSKKLPNHR